MRNPLTALRQFYRWLTTAAYRELVHYPDGDDTLWH